MSTAIRTWALWRRLQYGLGFGLTLVLIGMVVYYTNFYQPPRCTDLVQNGSETGVDCGGSCAQICVADVLPPRVVWAKSFEIQKGQYNAVAYLENTNQTAGIPELEYTIQLLNGDTVVAERPGKTVLPPDGVYPIFAGRMFSEGAVEVTDTKIILQPASLWLPASLNRDQFKTKDIHLIGADERPQLNVKIENTELTPAENVEVVATIFNDAGKPVTASQTFIDYIGPQTTKAIAFTWPHSIAKTVKSCVIPTDVVIAIDLSGSMNNDNDNPPQPITAALDAASQFVHTLKEKDQVAVLTFATKANLVSALTQQYSEVSNGILGLTIDPAEETGYTNTVAALQLAKAELNSPRHNNDARRVLVLLTDGLPTAAGDEDVTKEAIRVSQGLNDDGVEVYAIGLGKGVDSEFIKAISSGQSNAYFAPTGDDLAAIYQKITSSLCEAGPTKIDIITKMQPDFAPIHP